MSRADSPVFREVRQPTRAVLEFVLVTRAGLLAAFLAAAFATGCGGHGQAEGTIVFQSGESGRAAVYAVRPDGSGLTRLSMGLPAEGAVVSWTRDGTKAL